MPADLPIGLTPFDPDEDFEKKFYRRMGTLAGPFINRGLEEDKEKLRDLRGIGGTDLPFEPRPGADIEDQRGITKPELNLQAQYLRGRGVYGSLPTPPPQAWYSSQLDPSYDVDTPLGIAAGREDLAKQIARAGEVLAMHPLAKAAVVVAPKKVIKRKEVK